MSTHHRLRLGMWLLFVIAAGAMVAFTTNSFVNAKTISLPSVYEASSESYLKGRIVDASGSPLPNVTLALVQQGSNATSREDGTFAFTKPLKPGNYRMYEVSYNVPFLEQGSYFQIVMKQGMTTNVTLKLTLPKNSFRKNGRTVQIPPIVSTANDSDQALLWVTITDKATQKPIPNALVTAGGKSAMTDDTGTANFSTLEPGFYQVSTPDCAGCLKSKPLYYFVNLVSGKTIGMNLTVATPSAGSKSQYGGKLLIPDVTTKAASSTSLRITLVDADTGRPLPNMRVNIPHTDYSGLDGVITAQDLAPGFRELQFLMSNYIRIPDTTKDAYSVNLVPQTVTNITIPLKFSSTTYKGNPLIMGDAVLLSTPGTTALQITFINSITKEPVPNVGIVDGPYVYDRVKNWNSVHSDEKGVLYNSTADPGSYGAYIVSDRFMPYVESQSRYFITIVKDHTTQMRISLTPVKRELVDIGPTLYPTLTYTDGGDSVISGRLVGQKSGAGIAHAAINFTSTSYFANTDDQGYFKLYVTPGSYIANPVVFNGDGSPLRLFYFVQALRSKQTNVTLSVPNK